MMKVRDATNGQYVKTHGMRNSRIYRVWCSMKSRCYNENNPSFPYYGGRGIVLCNDWKNDFGAFNQWAMNNGYQDGLTIDRIDNNKGYFPENCRWVTQKIQNRNYSRNHLLTYNGETMCLVDMAKKYGINRATLSLRLKNGISLKDALKTEDRRTTRWTK